jgi:threonine/homoserine/homoserine lactone efflux protein
MDTSTLGSWVIVLGALFVIVLVVLWVLLPFAIFGMKDLLRELVREQKHTNTLLERLAGARSAITDREGKLFADTRPGTASRK